MSELKVKSVGNVTVHQEAIIEAGKKIIVDSIVIGRDFCKHMISVNTGSIAVYLALVKLLYSAEETISLSNAKHLIIPPLLYLFAAVIFTLGYFPNMKKFSMEVIEEIEHARLTLIKTRRRFTIVGISVFLLATLLAVIFLFGLMTTPDS